MVCNGDYSHWGFNTAIYLSIFHSFGCQSIEFSTCVHFSGLKSLKECELDETVAKQGRIFKNLEIILTETTGAAVKSDRSPQNCHGMQNNRPESTWIGLNSEESWKLASKLQSEAQWSVSVALNRWEHERISASAVEAAKRMASNFQSIPKSAEISENVDVSHRTLKESR